MTNAGRLVRIQKLVGLRVTDLDLELCEASREDIALHLEALLEPLGEAQFENQLLLEVDTVLLPLQAAQLSAARLGMDAGLDIEADVWSEAFAATFRRVIETEAWARWLLCWGGPLVGGAAFLAGSSTVTQAIAFAAGSLAALVLVCERSVRVARLCT